MDKIAYGKRVLDENSKVLYGIFGLISTTGYFPPRRFLNEFFMQGSDPCDQDGRMEDWTPFEVNEEEYKAIKSWWIERYPKTQESDLGQKSWSDWSFYIVEEL